MVIEGKITRILPLVEGVGKQTGTPWKSQSYVLETLDPYPKQVCFEVFGERIGRFDIQQNEVLTIDVDIESREWNGRWYTSIKAYDCRRINVDSGQKEEIVKQLKEQIDRQQVSNGEELPF